MKKILFIIQFDSFASTLIPVIKQLIKQKYRCDVVLLEWKSTNLRQLLNKNGWISTNILSLFDDFKNDLFLFKVLNKRKTFKLIKDENHDIIIIGTSQTSIIGKISLYIQKYNLKAKLVSGYAGALLNNNKQGFIKGTQRRSQTNLIWTPGIESKKNILSTNLINTKKTRVVDTGLPRFDRLYKKNNNFNIKAENICFFEQPTFPKTYLERKILVKNLIKLAEIKRDSNIIIKPRFKKKIGHAHAPRYLLQDILAKIKRKPKNIVVSHDHIYNLFKNCKLSLTISSTAGLESLLAKIPTFFISDFCRNKNIYGSDYFEIFNATLSFKDLYDNNYKEINYSLVKDAIRFDGENTTRLTQEIVNLVDVK